MPILDSECDPVTRVPAYNWGTGRLIPCESLLSFALEFCSVNYINRRTLSEAFPLILDSQRGPIKHSVCVTLAACLGEPLELLSTVGSGANFRTVFNWNVNELPAGAFRYCPSCLSMGVHFGFQENLYFRTCLIHGVKLERTDALKQRGNSNFERKMRLLGTLLDEAMPEWRNRSPKSRNSLSGIEIGMLRSMHKWCQGLDRHKVNDRHFYRPLSKPYFFRTPLHAACERIVSMFDAPEVVRPHLELKKEPRRPIEIYLPVAARRLISEIENATEIYFYDLFWLFVKISAMSRKFDSYGRDISRIWRSAFGREKHALHCKCQWRLGSDGAWRPADRLLGINYGCPYSVARREFIGRWLSVAPADASKLELDGFWWRYLHHTSSLLASGIDILKCEGGIPYVYRNKVRWQAPDYLTCVLEEIAISASRTEVSAIGAWLKAIENGKVPHKWNYPMTEFGLLSSEDKERVVIWPPVVVPA